MWRVSRPARKTVPGMLLESLVTPIVYPTYRDWECAPTD